MGDESPYVRHIVSGLGAVVPVVRDLLCERRKYFGHLCLKFVQQLLGKYTACVFRCKPCSVTVG